MAKEILIGCEESGTVTAAFRAIGINAYSCDILPTSGPYPEYHYQEDIFKVLAGNDWSMLIAFPPCTFLSSAGMYRLKIEPDRFEKMIMAKNFFLALWKYPIDKICLENPVGYINTNVMKPHQIIHPFYFGDPHLKRTCLWLKNLPRLNGLIQVAKNPKRYKPDPICVDANGKKRYFTDSQGSQNKIQRSKTFPSIAAAMAHQWSRCL